MLKAGEVNCLGPNLELDNCTVEIGVPSKDLIVSQVSMTDCEIVFPKKTSNYDWRRAKFVNCRFKGTLTDHDFGYSAKIRNSIGALINCDFRDEILDGCRFFEVNMEQVKLPLWPCFTVLRPLTQIEKMRMQSGPLLHELADLYEFSTANPAAITHYAPTVAKRYGISFEAILAEVEGKDWIIVNQ